MRILLLSQWFDPEPMPRGLAFARALREQGHEVEVLTGFPNYPGGKVYPGYRIRLAHREVMDGVPVLRVALYPSHDTSSLKRLLNYASFMVSAGVLGALFTRKPNVFYVYHPPLTVGIAAAFISLVKRVPFVYDIQDLWPDALGATGMVKCRHLLRAVESVCRFVYRQAAHIVVLSPGLKMTLVDRGVPEGKIDVIYNWADEGQLLLKGDPTVARELGMEDRFNVVYAGNIGKAQALEAVIRAAKILEDRHPQIQFILVGDGVETERLRQFTDDMGLGNVRFLPRRPMSEIGCVLGLAQVLLVHLRDSPLFESTIPSKTQAYLAMGKPILMAARGDAADLVLHSGGGIVCEPENPESMADGVRRLSELGPGALRRMGERGARFYAERLSLNTGTLRFIEVFRRLTYRM